MNMYRPLLLVVITALLLSSCSSGGGISEDPLPPPSRQGLWIETLPQSVQDSVIWMADHENGDLEEWQFSQFQHAGGGIFNSGEPEVEVLASNEAAHSGAFSAKTRITNAIQAQNGKRAIRLMRWTDQPWDNAGQFFPNDAYYSVWMYFPHTFNPNKYAPWNPGDGGWWIVFQFKSAVRDGVPSDPVWTLNVDHDDERGFMFFRLYSLFNPPHSYQQTTPIPIPTGQWVHVEAYYRQSPESDGSITIWQDGKQILDIQQVRTILSENVHWGIGNYTNHINGGPTEGTATLYFDDAVVSTLPVSGHPNSN